MRDFLLIASFCLNVVFALIIFDMKPGEAEQAAQSATAREAELLRKRLDATAVVLRENQIPYDFDYAYESR